MTDHEIITIRKATRKDVADLLIIDNMSSHGMSLGFWQHAVQSGEAEDALVFARERFADEKAVFGWSNAFVAESETEILGAITTYEMPEHEEDVDEIKRLFPDFVPVFDLFEKAIGDWFIDGLGVFPQARGKGIAGRLLDEGLNTGREQDFTSAALVVESNNHSAVKLYQSKGFETVLSLPLVGENSKGDWLLMNLKIGEIGRTN